MSSLWLITACVIAAAPPVEVTLLSGETRLGTLEKLGAKELRLQPETGAPISLATADLLELRLALSAGRAESTAGFQVGLIDGSRLNVTSFETTVKEFTAEHAVLGTIKLPLSAVRSVRLSPPEAKLEPLWQQILEKSSKNDQIVLRKQDVLDHLDGVVGVINSESIRFLLDGDEIAVKREKAFGIVYARKPSAVKLAAQVELINGDQLSVRGVTADEGGWQIESASGLSAKLNYETVARVDFSLGKVVYLSAVEPRSVKYTPGIQAILPEEAEFRWEFRRDRNLDGKPLRLGQKTYSRGLAIHSKTELKYRLGGEFRRFQAMLGIDDEISRFGETTVRILGDRQELFAADIRPRQTPIAVDLDVANVVELEIIVDFGPDKPGRDDIGDRVHLADARLVK